MLNPDQRIVLALKYFADLPIDEIARRTGARPGTIKSRIHAGLEGMRTALDPLGADR